MMSEGQSASTLNSLSDMLTGVPAKERASYGASISDAVEDNIQKYMSSASSSGSRRSALFDAQVREFLTPSASSSSRPQH